MSALLTQLMLPLVVLVMFIFLAQEAVTEFIKFRNLIRPEHFFLIGEKMVLVMVSLIIQEDWQLILMKIFTLLILLIIEFKNLIRTALIFCNGAFLMGRQILPLMVLIMFMCLLNLKLANMTLPE